MGRNRFLGSIAHGAVFIDEIATVAQVTDAEIITIGNKVYEFDDAGGVTAGNIAVTIAPDGAGSAAATILNLVAAINANKPTVPVTAYADPLEPNVCRIEADDKGAAGNIVFTTGGLTGISDISGAGLLVDGEDSGTQTLHRGTYTVDDVDIDGGGVQINTGLQTIEDNNFMVQVRGATGTLLGNTDLWTVRANKYIQGVVTGGLPIVAGDVIAWTAWE
ncbi:MAG: hypothetical protein LN413_00060 [Candidatus Thermoplasmatota archaeon]|nr:hypothetical protein [Candidatus Thermoplasmatota archaeon]